MTDARPAGPRGLPAAAKRGLDVLVAASALGLLLPLMLAVALAVRLGAGSPVLYREQRLGRYGAPFRVCKFRTLRAGSGGHGPVAPEDDPRIVGAGRWLRRWRLDELPQLVNVLRGQMSLVGPRPLAPALAATLPAEQLAVIQSVRPGLTDEAALYFLAEDRVLAGRPDAELLFVTRLLPARARMQVDCLRHWSLAGDCRILLMTLVRLWSPRAREASAAAVRALLDV